MVALTVGLQKKLLRGHTSKHKTNEFGFLQCVLTFVTCSHTVTVTSQFVRWQHSTERYTCEDAGLFFCQSYSQP